jgi:sugar lactone lactonase YvrE
MKNISTSAALAALLAAAPAHADPSSFPAAATVTTTALFQFQSEGLTGDNHGRFYTAARNAFTLVGTTKVPAPCPVWRIDADGTTAVVGYLPTPTATDPCVASGLAFDRFGDLYVGNAATVAGAPVGQVFRLTPNAVSPPTATLFARDVPGANGIAFDRDGNLWVSDGTTGQGRIWRIPPAGGSGLDAGNVRFRVQPMLNPAGVGRQIKSTPPGAAVNNPGDVIVANGIAFTRTGDLVIADTARGAIWKAELDRNGRLLSRTGCDAAFAPDTLCLDSVLVAHPYLESVDGIALDAAGNVWAVANARQAIVVVDHDRNVREIFRNPLNASGLRNGFAAGDARNAHIVEFPASPYLDGDRFCTSSFDGGSPLAGTSVSTRDNSPSDPGEIRLSGPSRGKISCIDQPLAIPGLPLPL